MVPLRRLTFLVHQELVEMAHGFYTEALDGPVRVQAQDSQHGHQLPNPSEVLRGLCGEHGIGGGPTYSISLATHASQREASTRGSLQLCGKVGVRQIIRT